MWPSAIENLLSPLPNLIRWLLVLPASLVCGLILPGLVVSYLVSIMNENGIDQNSFFFPLLIPIIYGLLFVYSATIVAPPRFKFFASVASLTLLCAILLLGYLVSASSFSTFSRSVPEFSEILLPIIAGLLVVFFANSSEKK
ncbi:MAG: hypothetical protein RLZZ283_229 [Candidatus Parcubacteria bacterium]|jgi:hypothetical protein